MPTISWRWARAAGAEGGMVIAQGSVGEVCAAPGSRIAPFLGGTRRVRTRERAGAGEMFEHGAIHLETGEIHTVRPLSVDIPRGRLTAVTGVSGSGKTTLVLESLISALQANIAARPLPAHVLRVEAPGLRRANLIDADPIGVNVRSTIATYSGVLDDLRRAYAALPQARERGLKAGAFSYNTGSLRCPDLRRHGADLSGRAVPARRGHTLPGLQWRSVRTAGL